MMKKSMKKTLSLFLALAMLLGALAGCADKPAENSANPSNSTAGTEESQAPVSADPIKIGILVADVSGEEALGFRSYYENYIANNYNVELLYTEQLTDAASERSAIERFAAQGCKAVISFSSSDRAMQIETCTQNKLFYAVASGMLDDEQFETYKTNEWFVGQVGPSMDTEFEAGYAMGKYFADKGAKTIAMYGAFIPNPMHVYRAAGVIAGMGATYGGASDMGAIVGQIFGDQGVDPSKVSGGSVELVAYFQGYGETTTDELNAAIQAQPDAFLSVGMATTFFTQQLNTAGIEFSDIDSFTSGNQAAMADGKLVYLAGKYSSSIGPIFAAVIDAVNGSPIRGEGSTAISVSQSYLVATDTASFDKYFSADQGDSPIYSKDLLDTVIGGGVTYADFQAFVEADRS